MKLLPSVTLVCCLALLVRCYFLFSLHRNLIGYHLGMNLSMIAGGVWGLAIGILLQSIFSPWQFVGVTIASTLIAMALGCLFGVLVDYQSVLSGVAGGVMGGVMGPMIVVHAGFDPYVVLFAFGLTLFTFAALVTSLKR